MKYIKKALAAVIAAILLFNINFALADFGGADIYDSSGYTDFDSDVGSDYDDYGGYESHGYTRYNYYDDDYDDNDDDAWDIVFIVLAAIIIISSVAYKFNKKGINPTSTPSSPKAGTASKNYPDKTASVAEKIAESDKNFSADKFIAFVQESYIKLQNSWSERNLESVRLILTPELFSKSSAQIEEFKTKGRINVIERIGIQTAYITDYVANEENETITVFLYATQKDYIIDENTKAVLEGSDKMFRYSRYLIKLIRAKGVTTDSEDGISVKNCPNCGAPLEITSSGKCAYCDSVISNSEHSWVISSISRLT